MKILVLNQAPHTTMYDVAPIERLLTSYATPGTVVEIGFIDNYEGANVFESMGEQNSFNGLHHMMEAPAIIRKIFWAAENGYDAVMSSNTFDPGVDGGRLAVTIPVIGPLRTSMHAALTLADRVGVLVPTAGHVPYTRRLLRALGLESFVCGMKPIGIYSGAQNRKAEVFDVACGLIQGLLAEGAEIILPLGGALIPYVVNPDELAAATGVQVLNTKAITIRFTEMCVRFNMRQSAITYPRANLKFEDFTKRL